MYKHNALSQYQKVDVEGRIAGASPHGLVTLLLEGVQKNLALAKGAMERQDIAGKGNAISKAIRIIDNLRASLDVEKGGEVAANLSGLYSYMERRLMKANMESNPGLLDEVYGLVQQIRSAWDAIPDNLRRG